MANKFMKIPSLEYGLYFTYIKPISFVAYKVIFRNVNSFQAWHDWLGHPGVGIMRKIIGNSVGLDLHKAKFPQSLDLYALYVLKGNWMLKQNKLLERIQGDICRLIQPDSGLFKYFMVFIDAYIRWSYVSLLDMKPWIKLAKIFSQLM
jgi:hypothetical protein